MSENLIYADLNLTKSTRLQKITDNQGSTYAEVKVRPLDTDAAASYTSSDKSCCSRTRVAVLVAVIIFLLVLVVCLILTLTPGLVLATETVRDPPQWSGENYKQNNTGCPKSWEKHGERCYFFSPVKKEKDWDTSRKECTDMGSDLVIINSTEELDYLHSKSKGDYYLLGLKYSLSEKMWKWINNVTHNLYMFEIREGRSDYFCAVVAHQTVETAPCKGTNTTQNMCEKATSISESRRS